MYSRSLWLNSIWSVLKFPLEHGWQPCTFYEMFLLECKDKLLRLVKSCIYEKTVIYYFLLVLANKVVHFYGYWTQCYCTLATQQWMFFFCFRARMVSLSACSKGFISFESILVASAVEWEIFFRYYKHVRRNTYLYIKYYFFLKSYVFC